MTKRVFTILSKKAFQKEREQIEKEKNLEKSILKKESQIFQKPIKIELDSNQESRMKMSRGLLQHRKVSSSTNELVTKELRGILNPFIDFGMIKNESTVQKRDYNLLNLNQRESQYQSFQQLKLNKPKRSLLRFLEPSIPTTFKSELKIPHISSVMKSVHETEKIKQKIFIQPSLYPASYQSSFSSKKEENFQDLENIEEKGAAYKFIIGNGNNSSLVREILQMKGEWQEVQSRNLYFNFSWQSLSSQINYDRMKSSPMHNYIVNHFEFHSEISSKVKLIHNLEKYCKSQQIFLFDITPTTYCIDFNKDNYENDLEEFFSFFLTKTHNHALDAVTIDLLRKKFCNKNILLSSESSVIQTTKIKTNYYSGYSQPRAHPTLFKGRNIWMIKPADFNRGKGIHLFTSLHQLNRILSEYQEESVFQVSEDNQSYLSSQKRQSVRYPGGFRGNSQADDKRKAKKRSRFVIQKYIESPLLINDRKFDIRMWVLISHDFKAYVFKEGYIRTACEAYDTSETSISNSIIHLTNNAIQKYAYNYGQLEQGNQLSFQQFEDYLSNKKLNANFSTKILPKIKEMIQLSVESVKDKLNPLDRKYCFEIFGYDFIIDNAFNPWLIEVNTNPCIEQSSDMLSFLLKRMLDNAFKIVLDPICKPQIHREVDSIYPVGGYSDNENLWEQLGQRQFLNIRGNFSSPAKKK